MNGSNQFPVLGRSALSYDVIVVGHLKWNPYFNEKEDNPPRGDPSTCTSTLICGLDDQGKAYRLLVDVTLRQSAEDYYFDLNRRTGLLPNDITHCFITHAHFDHQIGINYFPRAIWMAAMPVAEELKESKHIDGKKVIGVEREFLPGVYAFPLPGHTAGLHGIAFECDKLRIVVAGDGVMTKNHLIHNTSMFESDSAQAAETLRQLKDMADLIIPGHDNVIINHRT